jgi:hypothetical protein
MPAHDAMQIEAAADDATRAVLAALWAREPIVLVDSPPGAGKTGVVERAAVTSMARLEERCMVVTQTNQQAFDLLYRLCTHYPKQTFHFLPGSSVQLSSALASLPNLISVDAKTLPAQACVVVANAAKWSWVPEGVQRFDLQIVDEAYQLPDSQFHLIAGLADRHLLVGDPGQIDPVIPVEVERWRSNPAGPHVAAPKALLVRQPALKVIQLPVSRRLVQDTVALIQPAFYPALKFNGLTTSAERTLRATAASADGIDQAINLASKGASLTMVELPAMVTGEVDGDVAATMVALVERLLSRKAVVGDNCQESPLKPADIGIACAHVTQVNAVRERLTGALQEIFVETANRFQGLERRVMIVHHPLSGRADVNAFHLDRGRLCVMLSRHRVTCFVVGRAGIERQLLDHGPSGDRVLGIDQDSEYEGWRAHLELIQGLQLGARVVAG